MVRRLAGSDAGFLYIESPTNTSTCVDLMVLGPAPDGREPLTVYELRDHLARRLHLVPPFRWRLAPVPGGLDTPRWIDDPDFDLGYHVRQATLPSPGGDDELRAFVASQLPGLIDLRHPLWQVVLVDGLADGRQALVWRFHHSLADGAALVTILGRLFGAEPTRPAPAWRGADPARTGPAGRRRGPPAEPGLARRPGAARRDPAPVQSGRRAPGHRLGGRAPVHGRTPRAPCSTTPPMPSGRSGWPGSTSAGSSRSAGPRAPRSATWSWPWWPAPCAPTCSNEAPCPTDRWW